MPRKERIIEAGIYHIINRGVERRNIFNEHSDYEFFLENVENGCQALKVNFS